MSGERDLILEIKIKGAVAANAFVSIINVNDGCVLCGREMIFHCFSGMYLAKTTFCITRKIVCSF